MFPPPVFTPFAFLPLKFIFPQECHKEIRKDPSCAPKVAFTPNKSFKNKVSFALPCVPPLTHPSANDSLLAVLSVHQCAFLFFFTGCHEVVFPSWRSRAPIRGFYFDFYFIFVFTSRTPNFGFSTLVNCGSTKCLFRERQVASFTHQVTWFFFFAVVFPS